MSEMELLFKEINVGVEDDLAILQTMHDRRARALRDAVSNLKGICEAELRCWKGFEGKLAVAEASCRTSAIQECIDIAEGSDDAGDIAVALRDLLKG